MEMRHVKYFLALCGTLNFTRAAEKYNVSQPSPTRVIKQLEEKFGVLISPATPKSSRTT